MMKTNTIFATQNITTMAYNVKDIANHLLSCAANSETGELMTNMKLQKMLYYEQGFHLAYFGTPLFDEDVEAWMYGPVVPVVYEQYEHYGRKGIEPEEDNFDFTDKTEKSLFNEVFRVYNAYSAYGLANMTHNEKPWKTTPVGKGNVISQGKMKMFFKTRLK